MVERSTTNPVVNWYNYEPSQHLLDSLVTEAIQIYGQDMYYLPRRTGSFDKILFEDDTSSFDTAYGLPVYIKTADGFMNTEAFMATIGLEIRPQVTLTVSRLQYEMNILNNEPDLLRPREGDLVFIPLNKRLFEIKFVDDKPFFYQLGKLQMYDLQVELFEYSDELMDTGIYEIDCLQEVHSTNILDYALLDENGDYLVTPEGDYFVSSDWEKARDVHDPTQIGDRLEEEIDEDNSEGQQIIDWDEGNPFGEGRWG